VRRSKSEPQQQVHEEQPFRSERKVEIANKKHKSQLSQLEHPDQFGPPQAQIRNIEPRPKQVLNRQNSATCFELPHTHNSEQ